MRTSSKKQHGSIAISVLLGFLTIFQMLHMHVPEIVHEIAGVLFAAALLVHLVQHRTWFLGLIKGKWNTLRTINVAVMLGLFGCSALMVISGITMSTWATGAGIQGSALARAVHLPFVYLGFCLVALHAGLQARRALALLQLLHAKGELSNTAKTVQSAVFVALCAYGLWSFVHLNFAGYILGSEGFAFIDSTKPLALSALQYVAVFVLFAGIGYGIDWFTRKENGDKHE